MNLKKILEYFEFIQGPGDSEVKADLSYKKLRDDTLELLSRVDEDNPNKERLYKKIQDMFPKKPRVVGKLKNKLQQLNRRIQRMLPAEKRNLTDGE